MVSRRLFLKVAAWVGAILLSDDKSVNGKVSISEDSKHSPSIQGGIWEPLEKRKYSLEEIVFLNGVGGLGASGRLDADRDIVTTPSDLGFSLKIDWKSSSGPYWSIRTGLLPKAGMRLPGGFDKLELDLYPVAVGEKARMNVFLVETDDDRWVCWNHSLQELKLNQWNHIEVSRDQMTMWLLGSRRPQWDRVTGLALELGGGDVAMNVDGVRLVSKDGHELKVFNTEDDGLYPYPAWREPIRHPEKPGTVFLPFDEGRMGVESLLDTPNHFQKILGNVGTPLSGFSRGITQKSSILRRNGIPVIYYSSFASGYMRYLTRRQAWDVNASGRSLNWVPCNHTDWDCQHAIALAHPAVTEALRLKVDALLKAGIGVWMVVDYTFPWWDTLWGYAPAMAEAYRKDLAGDDEGIKTNEFGKEKMVRFHDYFKAYNGFHPSPKEFGLRNWSEFDPPLPSEDTGDETIKRRMILFLYLRSYEWVKLPDRIGRYMKSRGGQGLWMVPNPEDSQGSSDYVFLLRSAGVGNLFPEYFGDIGWAAEAGYASLPYLGEQAKRSGARLSIIQETGAGGHSAPYLDWRIAYNGVYAMTAAGKLDDFDNDFLDEATFEQMSDPKQNPYEFKRFRDGFSKAMAFLRARDEKPIRPKSEILCISERPPAKACGSIFFNLDQPYSLAKGLSRAHLVFDLRDSLDLETALENKRVVFYSPWAPRVGDLDILRRWLAAAKGRVMITHTFVPTRSTTEYWGRSRNTRPGKVRGGEFLGLGRIQETQNRVGKITRVTPSLAGDFQVGENLNFTAPLYTCEKGEPLVSTDVGTLLSRVRIGKGTLYYLHFVPTQTGDTKELDLRVSRAIARLSGITPVCEADGDTLVQLFHVGEGYSVVAWDAVSMGKWTFEYRAGIPFMPLEVDGVKRNIGIPTSSIHPWLRYDFWADQLESITPQADLLEIQMAGVSSGLFHLLPDTQSSHAHLQEVRSLRNKMRRLHFDSLGM